MRLLAALLLVLAAHDASACEPRGTPIFRIKSAPIEGLGSAQSNEPVQVIEVFTDGAWSATRDGKKSGGGCMPKEALALLKSAIARARFKHPTNTSHCMALPTTSVLYEAPQRGKRGQTASPCGEGFDAFTERAAGCVLSLVDSSADLLAACRGDQDKD
jgi:hypothetical protein